MKITKSLKRTIATTVLLLLFLLPVFVISLTPAGAQPAEFIFDQEELSYSGAFTLLTNTSLYSSNARIYAGTDPEYAEYELSSLTSNQTYLLYSWRVEFPYFGATRFTVDGAYLDTLPPIPTPEPTATASPPTATPAPAGWVLVGTIIMPPEPDLDPPILKIDRSDVNSGNLVVDAIKLVWVSSNVSRLDTTVVYTLPTTGDTVTYERQASSGDIMIAAPIWALITLLIFSKIWRVATGGG